MSAIEYSLTGHEISGSTYIKYHGTDTHVTVPEGITVISDSAFAGCTTLTTVSIPEGVTEIGPSAFEGCYRLKSIDLPHSVTSIRFAAFEGCASLPHITLPEGITAIEKWTFKDCAALTGIGLPNTVRELSNSAFRECCELTDITIPEAVITIGESTFRGCTALTNLTIPDNVKSIGKLAFRDCVQLESISIHENTVIGDEAFSGCGDLNIIQRTSADKKKPAPKAKPPRRKPILDDWLIIDGVLCNYSGTASHIEIPQVVSSISSFAFQNHSGITVITVPRSVTEIGENCFSGCHKLTEAIVVEGSYAEGYFTELGIPCRYMDTTHEEDSTAVSTDDIEELRLDIAETERLRREAEEAERLQREAAEAAEAERLQREAEEAERLLNDPQEAKRLRREAEQRQYEAELARQKRREAAALRKQYDKLYDDIARQDYIIMTNKGWFGKEAAARKEAEKRRTALQAQLAREFPKGRPK